jgi:CDP-glucose 4,6-dehydratase
MNFFGEIYKGRRVLITGHTGFKGSWLALWLNQLGADITGIALPPNSQPNHWEMLKLPIKEYFLDIRNIDPIEEAIAKFNPEIIFHLAAQPLVRFSYNHPLETWSTNVMGTANILEVSRNLPGIKAIIVITTDKCYKNREWSWGYREIDELGGIDPYSASKAATELLVDSYRNSFLNKIDSPLLATARAGNVVGGGDWSEDRLIPDLVRAAQNNQSVEIRSPNSTRPWQHVLESLSGYLLLGQKLLNGDKTFANAWNFGPENTDNVSVIDMVSKLNNYMGFLKWHMADQIHLHEAGLLYLDSAKARNLLFWKPVWYLDTAIMKTADWYSEWMQSRKSISHKQLEEYLKAAHKANVTWVN